MKRIAFLAVAATLSLVACAPPDAKPVNREFVCTDDDKLVERHVGVRSATFNYRAASWRIRYVDGATAHYRQPQGETCTVEDY